MIYKKLDVDTVNAYLEYLKKAISETPDEMMTDVFDEVGIRARVLDPFYQKTTSILAFEDDNVVGRIEYHFYGCMQDGYRMAYVDWVYVLPEYRHRGIAQSLFKEFEKECFSFKIDQYYLVRSEEDEANRFYHAFSNVELTTRPMLIKNLSK